ncbi:MAG: DUF5110 domain-containing protein, partial [Clostridia bacterium]|nr:DUF5110 domain-containing protein [Clostridia bacterium]
VDACGCSDEALSQKPVFTVVPGADGAYEHYSDARDGYGYKKGEYRIAKYFWNEEKQQLTDADGAVTEYRLFGSEA